jgi:C4-dicarboxylate transporter DctM subunit
MIFFIIMGTVILGYFLTVTRLPNELVAYINSINISPYAVLVLIIIFYILLGCIMDSLAMILVTVPIFYPMMLSLGFDPIWFGVIIVMMTEIGVITPPVGINVYVISSIIKNVKMETIFKGIIPFLVADLAMVVLVCLFPIIATFLPNLME